MFVCDVIRDALRYNLDLIGGKLSKLLATSEFWMSLAAVLALVLEKLGVMSQNDFNAVILPAIVYIVGRLTSKVAKAKFGASA